MVRWTAEADQIFFFKLVETSGVAPNFKAIAEAWPEGYEKPTPKALTEHWAKIKKDIKKVLEGSGSAASTPSKPTGARTPAGTPRTPANKVTKPASGSGARGSSSKAGKQQRKAREAESDDERAVPHVPKREADALASEMGFAENPFASVAATGSGAEPARVQRVASAKASVSIKQEMNESEEEDSDSHRFGAQHAEDLAAEEFADPFHSLLDENEF